MKKIKNIIPFQKCQVIWIEQFYKMGVITKQGITLPYSLGIPQQTLQCRIKKIKKNKYQLEKVRFLDKPKEFTKPICPYFYECGSCDWLHVEYKQTLNWKNERIKFLANKSNIDNFIYLPIEQNETPFYTRYKAIFAVQQITELKIGLYQKNSHDVIDIQNCLMVQPEFNQILAIIKKWMVKNNISGYDEKRKTGFIRHILIQKSINFNNISVTIIATTFNIKEQNELVKTLCREIPNISSINIMENKNEGNVILSDKVKNIYGKEYLKEKILDVNLKLFPQSFFQINISMATKLFIYLKEQLKTRNIFKTYEFYAGSGIISLILSNNLNVGHAFEINQNSVETGLEAIKDNNIKNIEIHYANLEESNFIKKNKHIFKESFNSAIIVDPPRKGISSHIIELYQQMENKYFIYISCNPKTFFADASKLKEVGLNLKLVKAFDFFPFTPHIELLGIFEK